MRKDQIERLEELSEQLADRFLHEADPAEWPGAGVPLSEWTDKDRGNAWWMKKNAMGTGGVLRFTLDVLAKLKAPEGTAGERSPEEEGDLERQAKDAQRKAQEAVAEAKRRAKAKPEYDRRTHGG